MVKARKSFTINKRNLIWGSIYDPWDFPRGTVVM